MSVLGVSDDLEPFLKNLDERKLVDLCADLLASDGHSKIRITDGPGDGQRDIHSVNREGEKCLTQSKYHSNVTQSVAAQELGEVVLGMVRFGYRTGLFITNARISPQAKRDCLNSYPGYSIDFIDGRELVRKVFESLILRAVWYDGISLDRVSYVLVVPIVARDLETDKPMPLLPEHQDSVQNGMLQRGRTQVQIRLQRGTLNTSVFGEYRSPRVRTISESGSSRISLTEAVLSGAIYLEDTGELLANLGSQIVSHIRNQYSTKRHFAVLIGRPHLTPLGGEATGARLELADYERTTLVYHDGMVEEELDWILPTQKDGWFLPDRPHVSQAEWIQWHNPKVDVCLDISVISPPSDAIKWTIEEQSDYFARLWSESLFMLLPQALQNSWEQTGLPSPDQWHSWDSDNALAVWPHPDFESPFRPMQIEPDYESLEPFPFRVNPDHVHSEFRRIIQQVERLGGKVISPSKARHMIAVLEQDPFPTKEVTEYPGRSLVFEQSIVPSPIDPRSRRMRFTVCWLIKASENHNESPELALEEIADRVMKNDCRPFRVTVEIDDKTQSKKVFLIVYLDYEPDNAFDRTTTVLGKMEAIIEGILIRLEKDLQARFIVQRATEKYWAEEIFLTFKHG